MSLIEHRVQRSSAGKTSKFADFSLVSFPTAKKHSIIKTSLINIDPLSPIGAQEGTIKAYGKRKDLLIIKSGKLLALLKLFILLLLPFIKGSRTEVNEAASRFSKESGSEEIVIPQKEFNSFHAEDSRSCDEADSDIDEPATNDLTSSKRSVRSQESLNLSNMIPTPNKWKPRTSQDRTASIGNLNSYTSSCFILNR